MGSRAIPCRPKLIGAVLAGAMLVAIALAGCARSDAQSVQTPPIPTFPVPSSAVAPTPAGGARRTLLPQDCEQVLSHTMVPALLGLPLDSVEVHTTIGVPQPNVQRLERVTCRYDRAGTPGELLEFTMSAYTEDAAARSHTAINLTAEQKSAGGPGESSPIGSAAGTYFVDGPQRILVVSYGRSALTVILQHGVVGEDAERSVVMDLAQRILPALPV